MKSDKKILEYDPRKIEKKWQKYWESKKLYTAKEDPRKKKFFGLIEFPYPSGDGLHVGHIRSNTAMDVIARKRRREGYNVLYPIGWDAFGLPTENYAIKTGIHPIKVTKKNTDNFRKQLKALGFAFDWSREVDTSDPAYYKWTQWIFLQFFKKGLAYKKKMAVNWCPKDLIVLANEEVINGACERCGTPVEKRDKEQWMLAITKYADRLDKDLDDVDFLEKIKIQQRNWIGRSEGAMIPFAINAKSGQKKIEVFTTRPDTLFGVTYMVLAPENKLVSELLADIENRENVEKYIETIKRKTDIERTDITKEKTGVELKGIKAVNPASKEEIPVWIADYVLADYGTGAVMAVPAHDERDFAFAEKYSLPVKHVIIPHIIDKKFPPVASKPSKARRTIHALVRDPATGKYLGLKWKEFPWTTFIVGGVEDGEDLVEAAKREVTEETGYYDLRFVRVLGGPVKAEYFAAHKDENRVAYTTGILFELNSNSRSEVSDEEKKKFDAVWLDKSEMTPEVMTCAELPCWLDRLDRDLAYTEYGTLYASGEFTEKLSQEIMRPLAEFAGGRWVTTYKLRDWVFSRQRYWGEPIPVVHCPQCAIKVSIGKEKADMEIGGPKLWKDILSGRKTGLKISAPDLKAGDIVRLNYKKSKKVVYVRLVSKREKDWQTENITIPVAIPEKKLPVKLPNVKNYKPTNTGESPLAAVRPWVETKCPVCGGPAKRETDTMPNWAGSSWYYLRYADPRNRRTFADKKNLKYWTPVDWYNGGMEHTTLHLLYSRFWHKFLYDLGFVPTKEPYWKRTSHGLILAEGGEKMSKSKGNVINPDSLIETFGADSLRLYEMFMGPFDQHITWNSDNIVGVRRFIERVWKLKEKVHSTSTLAQDADKIVHKTIKKVSDDIEGMRFNTAISSLMIMVNELDKQISITRFQYESVLKLLAPFAPHVTEELWSMLGNRSSIHFSEWPIYDSSLAVDNETTIVVQINGKVRGSFIVVKDTSREELESRARGLTEVQKWIEGKEIRKVVVVPNKLVNFVL